MHVRKAGFDRVDVAVMPMPAAFAARNPVRSVMAVVDMVMYMAWGIAMVMVSLNRDRADVLGTESIWLSMQPEVPGRQTGQDSFPYS